MTETHLGINVDSATVKAASVDLDRLAQAAVEAGRRVDALGDQSATTTAATRQLSTEMHTASAAARAEASASSVLSQHNAAVATSTRVASAAIREQTLAMHQLRFSTANIAAQFQDIAVTTAMGMSPWTIALQQGTQLSAALNMSGGGLGGVVRQLGGAFAAVLSPVSLLTVAVIGLGTAGVQALMSMVDNEYSAAEAAKEHKKWIDEVLFGYESAAEAANKAAEAAFRLPQGVVESDLSAKLEEQASAVKAVEDGLDGLRDGLRDYVEILSLAGNTDVWAGMSTAEAPDFSALIEAANTLENLALNANMSGAELRSAMEAARELQNTASDPSIRGMAGDVFDLMTQLLKAQAEVKSTEAALRDLQSVGSIDLSVNLSVDSAIEGIDEIRNLAPDLRTPYEKVQEALDNVRKSATDLPTMLATPFIQSAEEEARKTIELLDEQERRREALKASRAASSASENAGERWGESLDDIRQRIEATRLETSLIGESTFEVERQTIAHEMLNRAKELGIEITDEVSTSINAMAAEYATAQVELEQMVEDQRRLDEAIDFSKGLLAGFFTGIRSELSQGATLWEAFGNSVINVLNKIADKALGMAAEGIIDMLFSAVLPGTKLFSPVSTGLNIAPSFVPGGYYPGFAEGTNYAPGGMAWVGEKGRPELVNLPRGSQVIPLDKLAGGQDSGGSLRVHVTTEVRNGNLVPTMVQVAGQVAGRVVDARAPGAVALAQKNKVFN